MCQYSGHTSDSRVLTDLLASTVAKKGSAVRTDLTRRTQLLLPFWWCLWEQRKCKVWATEVSILMDFLLPLPMTGSWSSQTKGYIADTPWRGAWIICQGGMQPAAGKSKNLINALAWGRGGMDSVCRMNCFSKYTVLRGSSCIFVLSFPFPYVNLCWMYPEIPCRRKFTCAITWKWRNQGVTMTLFLLKGWNSSYKCFWGKEAFGGRRMPCPVQCKTLIIICAKQHLWINTMWLYIPLAISCCSCSLCRLEGRVRLWP